MNKYFGAMMCIDGDNENTINYSGGNRSDIKTDGKYKICEVVSKQNTKDPAPVNVSEHNKIKREKKIAKEILESERAEKKIDNIMDLVSDLKKTGPTTENIKKYTNIIIDFYYNDIAE